MKKLFIASILLTTMIIAYSCKKMNDITGQWRFVEAGKEHYITYFVFKKNNSFIYISKNATVAGQKYTFDGQNLNLIFKNNNTLKYKIIENKPNEMIGKMIYPEEIMKVTLTRIETDTSGNIQGSWKAVEPINGFYQTYIYNNDGSMSFIADSNTTYKGNYTCDEDVLVQKITVASFNTTSRYKVVQLTSSTLKIVDLDNGKEFEYTRQ